MIEGTTKTQVEDCLKKHGYEKVRIGSKPDRWVHLEQKDFVADLSGDTPIIGVEIAGMVRKDGTREIAEDGHGRTAIGDVQMAVNLILEQAEKAAKKEYILRVPPGEHIATPEEKEKQNEILRQASQKFEQRQSQEVQPPGEQPAKEATIPPPEEKPVISHPEQKLPEPQKEPEKKGKWVQCKKCGVDTFLTGEEALKMRDELGGLFCEKHRQPEPLGVTQERAKEHEKEHQKAQAGKDTQTKKPEAHTPEVMPTASSGQKPAAMIPIKSYTPQGCIIKGFIPQLKEIGKIKIGKKGEVKTSQGGKQYRLPVKIDHFEVVGIIKDEKTDDYLLDPVMKLLGDKPTELNILLLYNDLTLNFRTRYNSYIGGKCICAGDGETATTIEGEIRVCNPDACELFQKKKCKVNGILSCILMDSPRLGGVYKFRTTSYHTVRSILSSLMFLSTLTGGVLSMLPLKLVLSPMRVTPKDTTPQTIYVVNVEFAGTAQDLLQKMFEVQQYQGAMRTQILQLEQTARLALSEPESEEESKEVQEEFYPEPLQEAKK